MKACVIGSKQRSPSTMKIFEAVKEIKKFKSVSFIPIEGIKIGVKGGKFPVFHRNHDLLDFDAVIPRIGASKASFGYFIVKHLREAGVYVPMAPEAILIAHNKYLTLDVLNKKRIPVPETYMAVSPSTAKRIVERMGAPVVMKLLGGAGGKGVMFADNEQSAASMIDALNVLRQPLFIEKFIENPGEDIRVIVVGDEAVASMKRIAKKGEKRSNIAAGGKGISYQPSSDIERLAIRAAKAIGAEICGVDILEGPNGPFVLEVNLSPGLKIAGITGKNVAARIAEYVYEQTRNTREDKKVKNISHYIEKKLIKIPRWFKDFVLED